MNSDYRVSLDPDGYPPTLVPELPDYLNDRLFRLCSVYWVLVQDVNFDPRSILEDRFLSRRIGGRQHRPLLRLRGRPVSWVQIGYISCIGYECGRRVSRVLFVGCLLGRVHWPYFPQIRECRFHQDRWLDLDWLKKFVCCVKIFRLLTLFSKSCTPLVFSVHFHQANRK